MARSAVKVRNLTIISVAVLCVTPSATLARSPVEYCQPYGDVVQLKLDPLRPFLQYSLTVENVGISRKSVRLVADEIRITREVLGSLIKSAGIADASIASLTIDARRIVFVESLAFEDAKISFLAQEIEFSPSAVLSLLPSPTSQIALSAGTIKFSSSALKHFDVRLRTNEDDLSDINTILSIDATTVLLDDLPVNDTAQVNDLLARRFTLFPIYDFKPKIALAIGSTGEEKWLAAMKTAEWPKYTVGVWRSALQVAPFDRSVQTNIGASIEANRSLFSMVVEPALFLEVSAMSSAIRKHIDLDGNGPAWITNRPLSQLVKDVDEYADDAGRSMRTINFYVDILEGSAKDTPPSAEQIAQQVAREEAVITEVSLQFQSASRLLADTEGELTQTMAYLDDLTGQYKQREGRLRQHAEDLKRGAQQRGQIVSALATAASIAATAYTGDPSTGAAVGGVVYAVGGSTGGKDSWTSLSEGYKFYGAIRGPLNDMTGSMKSLKESRDTYELFIESFKLSNITIKEKIIVPIPDSDPPKTRTITRQEALEDIEKKSAGLLKGLDAAFKVYTKYTPEATDFPVNLEEDETLKSLAEAIATSLERVKQLTNIAESAQRSLMEHQLQLTAVTERIVAIKTLSIENEARRRALVRLAFEGVREELSNFTRSVDLLRRASLVEYREPLPVNAEHIRNAYQMDAASADWDPGAIVDSMQSALKFVDLVKARKTYVQLLAGRVRRASSDQLQDYVESRGRAPLVNVATEEFSDRLFGPPAKRLFLQSVNDLIKEQYESRHDRGRLAALYERRIEIPMSIREKLDARFPARLLRVAVLEASTDISVDESDLIFTVDVERVGNLRRGATVAAPSSDKLVSRPLVGQVVPQKNNDEEERRASTDCFSVDLRPKTTAPENYYVPYEFTIGQIRRGITFSPMNQQSYWYLSAGDSAPSSGRSMLVTYPPAEARMYMRVRLNSMRTKRWLDFGFPSIKNLTLGAEVFQ